LTDEKGLPLAVVLSGANTHDVKLLEETLDHIVTFRPEPDENHPQNLCLGAGYTGSQERFNSAATHLILGHVARRRKNWSAIPTFMLDAGSLRSHTLFSIAFVSC